MNKEQIKYFQQELTELADSVLSKNADAEYSLYIMDDVGSILDTPREIKKFIIYFEEEFLINEIDINTRLKNMLNLMKNGIIPNLQTIFEYEIFKPKKFQMKFIKTATHVDPDFDYKLLRLIFEINEV